MRPDIFGRDFFFNFGSQDSFTLFPAIHAWVIELLGLDRAALLLTILGKLVWFPALLIFSSSFLSGPALWLGVAVVVGYSPYFDAHKVFSYGESFVTARVFAEALVLTGLGLAIRGRYLLGVGALSLASALHPLMALPGIATVLLVSQWKSIRRPMVIGSGLAVVAVVMGILGVEPFDHLFIKIDPAWLDIVLRRNEYVYLHKWDANAFGRMVFLAVILVVARKKMSPPVTRIAIAMLVLGVVTLWLSWLGASVIHNALLTQLQLWRALWLVQLTSLLLLGGLTPTLWRGYDNYRILLVVLWCAALLEGVSAGMMAGVGLLVSIAVERWRPDWKASRVINGTVVLIICYSLFWKWLSLSYLMTAWNVYFDRPAWQTLVSDIVVVTALSAISLLLSRYFSWAGVTAVLALGAGMTIAGTSAWAGRTTTRLLWDEPARVAAATHLRQLVPSGATVFWPDGLEKTWFWLRRAHYVSGPQTAGVLFSRDTALEANRRQSKLRALGFQDGNPYWGWSTPLPRDKISESGMNSPDVERRLCEDPILDYLVLPAGMHLAVVATFLDPLNGAKRELINCRALQFPLPSSMDVMQAK